jgi:hypothetical protein
MRLLKSVDRGISVGMESAARRLNRREVLYKGAKYAAAATAAASVGDLGFASPAFAEALLYKCCDPYSGKCGTGQHPAGCPEEWAVCTTHTAACECVYSNGHWVSPECSPCDLGTGSFRLCIDCYKIGTKNCADLCTVVTDCQCKKCSTPAEVKAEMLRLQEELAQPAPAS